MEHFFTYLIYFLLSIVNIFIIRCCIKTLVQQKNKNKYFEQLCYLIYCFFYFISYFCKQPLAIILFINIIGDILIFYNYKINIKNKLICWSFIYCMASIVEIITYILLQNNTNNNIYVQVIVFRTFLYYILFVFLKNINILKTNVPLDVKFWIPFFSLPLLSVCILIYSFITKFISTTQMLIYIFIMFFFNINLLYLYKIVVKTSNCKLDIYFLQEKNKLYSKQLEIISNALDIDKELKHDLKNHLITIKNLIQLDKKDETLDYLENILKISSLKEQCVYTGNIAIDSILNFKLQQVNKINLDFKYNVVVPKELNIEDFDLVIILGNLLDNSLEANLVDNIENKFIDLSIKFDRNRLIINLKNSFDGIVKYQNNKIVTKKSNKNGLNGIGLKNVKKVVEKYDGVMDVSVNDCVFSVDIILFMTI